MADDNQQPTTATAQRDQRGSSSQHHAV